MKFNFLKIGGLVLGATLATTGIAQAQTAGGDHVSPRYEMVTALSERGQLMVVWGGGDLSVSSYSSIMTPKTIDHMAGFGLSGYKWIGASDGTAMNAELVTFHPTHVALGQNGLLKYLQGKPIPGKPGMTYNFQFLQEEIANECHFMVTSNPGLTDLGRVSKLSWNIELITGSPKSGSFGAWDKIVAPAIEGLSDIPVTHQGDLDDLNGDGKVNAYDMVESVKANQHQVGFVTMRPQPGKGLFDAIQQAGLHYVPVVAFELVDHYGPPNKIRVANSGKIKHQTTSCTGVSVITGVTSDDLPKNDNSRIEYSVSEWGTDADREELKKAVISEFTSWRDWVDNFVEASQDEFEAIANAVNDSLN